MTTRNPLFVLALLAVAAAAAHAQEPAARSDSPETGALLYGQSLVLPREAAVCGEHVPGYAPRFQGAFDAWRADNAQRIAVGDRFMHDAAAKAGANADASVAKLGDDEVARLRKMSPDTLAHHCELLLETLAPQAN